jgi:hypothetical protein
MRSKTQRTTEIHVLPGDLFHVTRGVSDIDSDYVTHQTDIISYVDVIITFAFTG